VLRSAFCRERESFARDVTPPGKRGDAGEAAAPGGSEKLTRAVGKRHREGVLSDPTVESV